LGRANIALIHQGVETLSFPVDENHPGMTVGREPDNSVCINDESASRRHGKFIWERGEVYYIDLNSTNGSFIDNRRVSSAPVPLYDGAVVSLSDSGAVHFIVTIHQDANTGAGQPPQLHGKNTVFIGRDLSCGVVLSQAGVSRFHAKLLIQNDGVYIEDNHSTNGTFVNGLRIEKPVRITESDAIHISGVCFWLRNGTLIADAAGGYNGLPVYARSLSRKVIQKGTEKTILDDVSLTIKPNEFVAIIGGSGAGKSTLMKILCGITSEHGGAVEFDSSGMAGSRNAYKSTIGYAPQNDILYGDLTLYQMLFYSAKLKMPQDTQQDEYERRVAKAMQSVKLENHGNTPVKKLSGGQRKRASIAVELLSDPRLFFLDEPTSGLDPATERNLMGMLKDMARNNKTIVAITHMTQNINLCDKLIVLGRGGKLCFFGTPGDACTFFGVDNFIDIYDKVDNAPEKWQAKYRAEHPGHAGSGADASHQDLKRDNKIGYNSGFSQFSILSARYLKLILGDRKRLLLLLLQAPVLGILLMLVATSSADDGVFAYSSTAKSMLFSLTCAAFWIGMLNSIQEICKERAIFEREKISTVRTLPYIASKLAVIGLLCVLQALALTLVVRLYTGPLPQNIFGIQPFSGYFLTVLLTTLCAACLGLAVSALSPNPDRAMAIAPIILLPQILFSGVVFELSGFMGFISNLIPSKLSMQNFGILTDLNALPTSSSTETKSLDAMYSITNTSNFYGSWFGLVISSFVYIAIFAVALKWKDESQ